MKNASKKVSGTYRWIDKDPIIDEISELIRKDGRSIPDIAEAAYLSPVTLYNWIYGKTRKPNNVSIDFTLRALGFERPIIPMLVSTPTIKVLHERPVFRWRVHKARNK